MKTLTVRDLISELEKIENKDAKVVVTSSNFEQNGSTILAKGIYKFEGVIKNRNFRDAFDGYPYSSLVVSISHNDSDIKEDFIQII